eukprot:754826-Hanusia_phi.AAC.2
MGYLVGLSHLRVRDGCQNPARSVDTEGKGKWQRQRPSSLLVGSHSSLSAQGVAFVQFADWPSCEKALHLMDGQVLAGRDLQIRYSADADLPEHLIGTPWQTTDLEQVICFAGLARLGTGSQKEFARRGKTLAGSKRPAPDVGKGRKTCRRILEQMNQTGKTWSTGSYAPRRGVCVAKS